MLDQPHKYEADITAREKEVLQLLVLGLSNKVMGHELGTSPRTIDHHSRHLLKKMGARNRAHMAAIAVALDMVSIVEVLRAVKDDETR